MSTLPHRIFNQQLGVNCNPRDTIQIEDFRGYLAWTYAQKTDEQQSFKVPLAPMTLDHGGADLMVTISCESLGAAQVLTLSPGQELSLPDCKGETLILRYAPIDHVAVVFVESSVGGVLTRAG